MSTADPSSHTTKRTYVLDTNVLIYDPNAFNVFDEHDLVLPIVVIEEVDRFKRELTDRGRAARAVSRSLDKLRAAGSLAGGVVLPGGGRLRVELGDPSDNRPLFAGASDSADNVILRVVKRLHADRNNGPVVFVTRDVNMRLKADALGVLVEDYEHAHIEISEDYTGIVERDVAPEVVAEAYAKGGIPDEGEHLCPHQFVVLRNREQPTQTAMTRFIEPLRRLQLVARHKEGAWGVFPRNREQLFALDLLLDDSVPLVTIDGMAGTGKTLIAIAAGLKKVTDDKTFRRLVVARPVFPLGKDIGFLPGTADEKLNPWMKPIFDALELLITAQNGEKERRHGGPPYKSLLDQGLIEVEPLTYIRGRSLPKQFVVVDEAQNLTPHEAKTIVTRAGEGTKVIFTGDRHQIDNPYVDATSNGLSYVAERMRLSPMAAHITLRKGERSPLAETAAERL